MVDASIYCDRGEWVIYDDFNKEPSLLSIDTSIDNRPECKGMPLYIISLVCF